ncbi:MAG: S1 RNA-binding domain-containing protein [Proteobacteria bacterium]|nr:S1 RNA-binding domain-containing protein [Pseudomonadota bacterium]
MDFQDFVKKAHYDEPVALKDAALQRLGRALNRAQSMDELLENNEVSLNPFSPVSLARLADAHRSYLEWKDSAKILRRSLSQSGLSLPDGSYNNAQTPYELDALERIAGQCQRSGHPNQDDWAAAVKAHVTLFRSCVELSVAHGSVIVELKDSTEADAGMFNALVTSRTVLTDLCGRPWLSLGEGEEKGILKVTLELPDIEMQLQVERVLPELGLLAEKRGAETVKEYLLGNHVEPVVRDIMDNMSKQNVFDSIRSAYMSLLATKPTRAEKIIAVYSDGPDGTCGVAVLDKKGDVLEHTEISVDSDGGTAVKALVEQHQPQIIVFPDSDRDHDRMKKIEEATLSLTTCRVDRIAVDEARKKLSFGDMASSAVVLGRRLLKPGREWGRVDPLSLNLEEIGDNVDHDQLRHILFEAKLISSWNRRQKKAPKQLSGSRRKSAIRSSGKKLNPSLKSIRDLRPGMTVEGIITNLTRFGAFVNIGLPVEGMIHVSQLSIEFVEDPSHVVKIGQQLRVRVLEVVPEKERIALSLKPPPDYQSQEKGTTASKNGPQVTRREPPKTRNAALADLDALFKKQ